MEIIAQLIALGVSVVIGFLVWQHYSEAKYPLSKRYSTFWPRFFEGTIDGIVLWPLQALVALNAYLHGGAKFAVFFMILQQAGYWTYSVYMHTKYGQTIGKMVCKVKILDADTELPITFYQAFSRDAVPIVLGLALLPSSIKAALATTVHSVPEWSWQDSLFSSLAGFWFLLEVITMLTNDKRRALHDFIAGTVVVRTTAGEEPEVVGPLGGDVVAGT
jgi:uncharacterized RDD family membrane protein YckC